MGRQDMEWISKHQKEIEVYGGKWIAVCNNEIVGVGKTAKEALQQGVDPVQLFLCVSWRLLEENLGTHLKYTSRKFYNPLKLWIFIGGIASSIRE